jgi:hypothetical protein
VVAQVIEQKIQGAMRVVESKEPAKIGELLVKSGFLQATDIVEAIQVSKRVQIPIGRVLMASGLVTENLLQVTLSAQLLLRDHLVSEEKAAEAIKLAYGEEISLKEALQRLNVSAEISLDTANLAELLRDSDIVTEEELENALKTSSRAGIPLSGALVLQGVISQTFYPNLTRAHELLKEKTLPREKIVEELKTSFLVWLKAEETLKKQFASSNEYEGANADQRNEDSKRHFSKDGNADRPNGKKELVHGSSEPTAAAFDPKRTSGKSAARLVDILKAAGVLNHADIERAYEELLNDPIVSASLFQSKIIVDEKLMRLAVRCQNLLNKKLITFDEAVRTVRSARSGDIDLDQALMNEVQDSRARYFDSSWRRSTLVKAVGGAILGVLVAGLMAGRQK